MMSATSTTRRRGGVGADVRKVDGIPKVRGEFEFASDQNVNGMLFGATARSPHAHARIDAIDIREAAAMPGVRAVLTHRDVPGQANHGLEFADQPVLAHDRVRHFGEPVAIVAAEDPVVAARAARAIRVSYSPLPTIADAEHALASAPLHERPPRDPSWHDDPRPNVLRTVVIHHGDPAFKGDVVVEGVYELGMQDQAFLGPEAGLAIPDGAGGLDLYVATQYLHADRAQLMACLGLGSEQVRVHLSGVGGAFGGREDMSVQIHAAMLALRTGRPVRMSYDRQESFVGHVHRHPARIRVEHHATRDGRLVGIRCRALLDGGAYASCSASVTGIVALFACGAYQVPNADIEATSVFTNNPPCGAMRGFGVFQVNFAGESQMDRLAARLGIDPVELRLMNALRPGDVLPTGQRLTNTLPVQECIRRCQALSPPEPEPLPRDPIRLPGGAGNTTRGEGVRLGEGFAVGYKNMLYPEGYDDHAFARVRLIAGGGGRMVAEVHSAAVEYGQGVTNVITQVVNTELEVDDVVLVGATTVGMKPAGSTAASRQTSMTGGAVRACCLDLRQQLAERETPLGEGQSIEAEHVHRSNPTTALHADTGQALGERVVAGFVCAAMRARVEVDVDLGLVRVVWLGVAQDAGKVINPLGAAGQVAGATAQGLGMALMEEIQTRDGIIRNPSFTDYLIPTTLDMPPIDIEFVEEPEADGAYGVKGVGECAIIVAHAAVAAAVRQATGRSLDRLPIRPDDIVF